MQEEYRSVIRKAVWLDKATKLKEIVFAKLESMDESQRGAVPAPGEWSASSVVEHLILVEENLVGLWRENLLALPSPEPNFKSAFLSNFVSFAFSSTNLRVPTVTELEPKAVLEVDELRERWDTVRENLVNSLPDDPRSAWILHPIFGPLSNEQMGKLLASHLEHHLRHWPAPKLEFCP